MGRFSGETQTGVITGLGTGLRMKAKDSIPALQPAGTGQREGPCPDGRAAILSAAAQSAAAQSAADGSLPISDNADGNQERNRGYRANSMRKVGAQPISIQKIHIIY